MKYLGLEAAERKALLRAMITIATANGRHAMSKLDRYLSRELAQSTFAALVVLLIVSLGGVFADVLSDIARGRVPAKLMLAQLGLSYDLFTRTHTHNHTRTHNHQL